jgi:hypothetical protein
LVTNFIVTLDGLEEQLRGNVMKYKKAALITRMNNDKIPGKELEDNLRKRFSAPAVDLIEDSEWMNTLNRSKKMSTA